LVEAWFGDGFTVGIKQREPKSTWPCGKEGLVVGEGGGVKYSWNRFIKNISIDVHLKYKIRNIN
jgi:hypothetical protein